MKDLYDKIKSKLINGIMIKEKSNNEFYDSKIPFQMLEKRLVERKHYKRDKPYKK